MASNRDLNYEEDEKSSRINAAGIINITLENLWRDSYSAMSKGDFTLWNTKLDSIWAILGGDCKEGDDDDKLYSSINLKLYQSGSLKSKTGTGFEKKDNPNNSLQYQYLLKKSLFLRRLQNKQGKGTAYETGDDYDFD